MGGLTALVLVPAALAGCGVRSAAVAFPSTAAPSVSSSGPVPVLVAPTSVSAPPSASASPSASATAKAKTRTRTPQATRNGRWAPTPGSTWQWQLSGPVDTSVDVDIYDVDLFNTSKATVDELHRKGRKVICYFEAGGAENYRPDYGDWPKEVLGAENGWPGERWLDIRNPAKLEPVLAKRLDMCRDKGFDGAEPDLMDGAGNETGFPITARHQLTFNRFVARMAHERGLAVGLKNDLSQVDELVGDFDFAVNESCYVWNECALLTPFIRAGKAVLHAEYESDPAKYCPVTKRLGISSLQKKPELGVWRKACPA